MPRLSRIAARTAWVHLVVGTLLGALILVEKGLAIDPRLWALLPAHIELVLLGWTVQIAFAVAFWILPRHPRGRRRGHEGLMWAAWVSLNLGIILVVIDPFHAGNLNLEVLGRGSELLAAGLAISQLWPRVKPGGT
jgi:hypothetical protein